MSPIPFIFPHPPSSFPCLTFEQGLEDGYIHVLLAIFALSEYSQELLAPHYVLDLQGEPWARNQHQHLLPAASHKPLSCVG